MPDNRYVNQCYNMLKMYDSFGYVNWVSNLRKNVCENWFGYTWEKSISIKWKIVCCSVSAKTEALVFADMVQQMSQSIQTMLL